MTNGFWGLIVENMTNISNWYYIFRNPNITVDIIENNPDKPWDWFFISEHPNITWGIIQGNPDKPWNWHGISKNPNITCDIVKNNPDKQWEWDSIFMNEFCHHSHFRSSQYRKSHCKKRLDVYRDELIQKVCTPARLFNWNEEIQLIFSNEYHLECNKWRLHV